MFPPPISREPAVSGNLNPFTRAYRDVVIYDEADADDPLYEGSIVVYANGWIELEGNRLLSPSAIHHIDVYDDEADEFGRWDGGGEGGSRDGRGGGAGESGGDSSGDGSQTNRFRP